MADRKFVLSTVGISVLLNVLDSSEEALAATVEPGSK
jgi:hypothetical protein